MLVPTKDWNQKELELQGFPVRLRIYRLEKSYVAEVEQVQSGTVIAQTIACSQSEAERLVIGSATRRLFETCIAPRLTVGG